ncbi:MAG: hypothetical protein J6I97_06475 [Agathobacter sp.]|nr:hypothetical protein [Agathobacter sp.]
MKSYLVSILYLLIGAILLGLSFAGKVDEFWNGMGSALLVMGVIQLIRRYRLEKNEAYREKIEIETNDERNQFIRNKAWAWAGYLFVMIMAVTCIVLRIVGQDVLSMAASGAVCLVLVLFWGSYYILKRKY